MNAHTINSQGLQRLEPWAVLGIISTSVFAVILSLKAPLTAVLLSLGLLGVPILLPHLFSFKSSFFLLILSLILEKYSYYVGFSIRLPMLFIAAMVIGYTVRSLIIGRLSLPNCPLLPLFVLLLLNHLLGAVWAIAPIKVIRVGILYLLLISLFLILYQILNSRERLNWAVTSFIATAFIGACYGVYQVIGFVFGLPIDLPFIEYFSHFERYTVGLTVFKVGNTLVPRINSTFNDPVLIGTFAGMGLMMLISKWAYRTLKGGEGRGFHLSYGAVGALLFICAVASFSRSTWLGLFCGGMVLMFYLIQNPRSRRLLHIGVLLAAGLILTLVFIFPNVTAYLINRALSSFDLGHHSTAGHYKWLLIASDAWASNPFFGVGLNNFGEFYARHYGTIPYAMTHSAYFSFLAETGFFGFVLEMGVIVTIILSLINAISKAKDMVDKHFYYLLIGLLSAYITMLAANITYHFYTQFYVWAASAMSFAAANLVLRKGKSY